MIASLNPDLVHVNGLIFSTQTRQLRKTLPGPVAIALQDHANLPPQWSSPDDFPSGSFATLAGWLWRILHQPGLRAADGFLFAAAEQAQPLRRLALIRPHQPVYEVMEGSSHFRPQPKASSRAATGLPGNPALLWVGNLNRNKDPLTVLAGFQEALSALPEAHLTMIYASEDLLSEVRERVWLPRPPWLPESISRGASLTTNWPPGIAPRTSLSWGAIGKGAAMR